MQKARQTTGWQNRFTDAVCSYTRMYGADESLTPFQQLAQLTTSNKIGVWKYVSDQTGAGSPEKCRNYFHNTWSKAYFDDVTEFTGELAALVQEEAALGAFSVQAVVSAFCAAHPTKSFYQRYLSQLVSITRQRQLKKQTEQLNTSSEGFSVSIGDCVAFQDAVQE